MLRIRGHLGLEAQSDLRGRAAGRRPHGLRHPRRRSRWDPCYANRRILELTGYQAEELDGRPVAMLVPEELHGYLKDEQEKARAGDARTRLSALRRKDGRAIPVVVAPQWIEDQKLERAMVVSVLIDLADVHTARPWARASGKPRFRARPRCLPPPIHLFRRVADRPTADSDRRSGAPDALGAREGDPRPAGPEPARCGDRRAALHQPEHRAQSPEGDLPQGRRLFAGRAARLGRPRSRRPPAALPTRLTRFGQENGPPRAMSRLRPRLSLPPP